MNDANEPKGTRKRAVWIAALVALLGLTIAPGFSCTYESNTDGSTKTTVQSE